MVMDSFQSEAPESSSFTVLQISSNTFSSECSWNRIAPPTESVKNTCGQVERSSCSSDSSCSNLLPQNQHVSWWDDNTYAPQRTNRMEPHTSFYWQIFILCCLVQIKSLSGFFNTSPSRLLSLMSIFISFICRCANQEQENKSESENQKKVDNI